MVRNTALNVGDLCQSCGLCCSGALFSYAKIYPDEKDKSEELNLNIYQRDKRTWVFNFPCPHLDGTRCSVYNARPKKCVSYFCTLAKNVAIGNEDINTALDVVVMAKEDAQWLTTNAPSATDEEKENLNIRDYLGRHQKEVMSAMEVRKLTPQEKTYSYRAFEFIKRLDRHIRETSLISEYITLIQTIDYKDTEQQ